MDHRNSDVVPLVKTLSNLERRSWCRSSALAAPTALAQPFDIFPPEKLVAGMKGYGVTDMGDGKGIQKFDVEILGLLKRYAPGRT